NEIQVKGTGTSTITALQAAGGSFSAGSTTASFVVSLGAAPTQPTRNAWDVVSVFASPLYTDVAGTDFNPNWGQAGGAPNVYPANMTTPSYGGDAVKQYQNSGTYQGTRLGSDINVSAINKLHVNIYSPTITSLRLFLIKTTDGSAENFITVPLTPGVWNNVDVTVNATTFPGLDLTKIREIKYDQFAGNSTLVIDNFYFWRDATLQPPTVGVFTVPAKLVGAADFTITPPTSNNTSPFTYTSSNTNVATIVNGNQIRVLGDGTSTITASQVSDGNFGPSTSTASFVVSYPAPAASPALAPRNPGTVVPFYTGGSTTSPYVSTFTVEQASWSLGGSQSNLSFSNGANNCAQVNNLGFFGFVRTGNVSFNVTTMSKLHVDIYLNASVSNLKIFLLTNGDQLKNSGPLAAGWNSLDINLSDFAGANLSNVFGFKFEKDGVPDPKIQIYLDNIYFYIPATVPVVTNFPSLTKTTSSAPFDLIQPTSTSPSTVWTYTSSNTAVATISGTKVTIKGAGTAIITANQAATVGFEAGSISTTLAVSLNTAAPTPPVRNAWDVISYYSDSYAVASTPTWGGSPNSDVSLVGNTTRLLGDYTVATVAFAPKNVSAMTTLHVDIYSTNQSPTYIWLNDVRYTANTPIGWTRLDIPLTSFPGVTLSAINLVRIENPTGAEVPRKTAYIDNIYFYRPATLQIPEITPSQCNQTLANIDDYVYANYVAGAQSFLWEVTELDGSNQPVGAPQTRQTYLRNLRISELPKFAYGKTYSIRVSVTVAGVPTPFNNPCKISTPLAPVKLINCAAVLTTLNTNLECNYVRYITPYFFHVTNNALGYDYTFTNTNRVLVVKQLPGLLPGTTYNVQVSYRNKDNSISAEGGLCSFTTPAAVAKFADSNSAIGFDAISYPNPFTNDFSINVISNVQDKVQISVYDMVGRLVDSRNSNVSDLQSLRVGNNYQAGVYNVVVSQGMNVKTLRVVKR
ncbi:MAG TPA: T9SS type A sorting domain-containing protein, partial [Flavobacterium sp.]|nr:T9SS type A sorting domain-containing protein [Flavobacterium sp.]